MMPQKEIMKRAFTLIELLVVIAIIAILAAILFPVFAQAKEAAKKTSSVSTFKQLATSTLIYSSDSDDLFPLAFSWDGTNWRWNFTTSCPNGWRADGVRDIEPRRSQDGLHWSNSLMPYIKNQDMYAQTGLPVDDNWYTGAVTPGMRPTNVGLSMNGLLHQWSGTAVELPSQVPMFSGMTGKHSVRGRALTNPAMNCAAMGATCNAANNAGTTPGGFGFVWFWDANISAYSYGEGMIFANTDSSTKFRRVKMSTDAANPTRDYYSNPFVWGNAAGVPSSRWGCNFGRGYFEDCVFSPNKTQ